MSKKQKPKLSRRELARHTCKDCGVNVIEIGEYYMVNPAIWKKVGLTWTDNLCIGCLEARLGRTLGTLFCGDWCTSPENPGGFENSERYARRALGEKVYAISKLKRGDPLPRGWKWKKLRGRWYATHGHTSIG